MTDADILRLTEAITKIHPPDSIGEASVFGLLVVLLIGAVVFTIRWLVRVTENARQEGTALIRETTAALTANTASNREVAEALKSLAGEVRHDPRHIEFPRAKP